MPYDYPSKVIMSFYMHKHYNQECFDNYTISFDFVSCNVSTAVVEFGFRDQIFLVSEGDGTVSLCVQQMGTIPDELAVTLMVSTVDIIATGKS